jgi:Clp amino terminal domain, pathogenicity island component
MTMPERDRPFGGGRESFRRRETVDGLHLLYALTRSGRGWAADLLARYGSSAARLNTALESVI